MRSSRRSRTCPALLRLLATSRKIRHFRHVGQRVTKRAWAVCHPDTLNMPVQRLQVGDRLINAGDPIGKVDFLQPHLANRRRHQLHLRDREI
jgi:hypothetical protein